VERPAIIGNYVVDRELGRGGMGIVYAARHRVLGRPAAIKVLLVDTIQHRDRVERFFNEARAAMAIDHPGVVKIYDVGIAADDRAYIAMELLAGSSLSARLQRGPLPIRTATDYARKIAAALVAIHGAGIVHRDLKPDNIIVLDRDGEVKIVDFGIAKLAEPAGVRTATGALLGTPAYMSPEQCEGLRELDARADLYSLGCILFAMLTSRPPFERGGTGGIIASHLQEPAPPLRSRCPGASGALEAVVACLVAKSRDERFGSARAVLGALSNPEIDELGAAPGGAAATADGTGPRPGVSGGHGYAPTEPAPTPAAQMPRPTLAPPVAAAPGATTVPDPARARRRAIALVGGSCALTAIVVLLLSRSCGGSSAPPTATATHDAGVVAHVSTQVDAAPAAPVDAGRTATRAPIDAPGRGGRGSKDGTAGAGSAAEVRGSPPDARVATAVATPPDAAPAVEPAPPPRQRLEEVFLFAGNSFSFSGDAAALDRIARAMNDDPRLEASITGYADTAEGGRTPQNLAGARANAIKMHLVNRGVGRDRFSLSSRVGDPAPDGSSRAARIVVK
jgi:serine/threonine-protein kinase